MEVADAIAQKRESQNQIRIGVRVARSLVEKPVVLPRSDNGGGRLGRRLALREQNEKSKKGLHHCSQVNRTGYWEARTSKAPSGS